MTDEINPERRDDNILQMRWLFQRELGGDLVFVREVTIPPGAVEGTHRHIGSEELYYIVSGSGIAYMADGDDPTITDRPLVQRCPGRSRHDTAVRHGQSAAPFARPGRDRPTRGCSGGVRVQLVAVPVPADLAAVVGTERSGDWQSRPSYARYED